MVYQGIEELSAIKEKNVLLYAAKWINIESTTSENPRNWTWFMLDYYIYHVSGTKLKDD